MTSEVVDHTSGKSEATNTLSAPSQKPDQESDYTTAVESSGQRRDECYTTMTNASPQTSTATGAPQQS